MQIIQQCMGASPKYLNDQYLATELPSYLTLMAQWGNWLISYNACKTKYFITKHPLNVPHPDRWSYPQRGSLPQTTDIAKDNSRHEMALVYSFHRKRCCKNSQFFVSS